MARRFRFGVNFVEAASGAEWVKKCRRAEAFGYDVLLVPDHLGLPSPFPSLVAAAEATERPRVGTFVLNAAFWNPVLLAREAATVDQLTEGRLELGLGTGYVRSEFDDAGLEYGTPRSRVDHLERTIGELDRLLGDPSFAPRPEQGPRPPLLLGGNGPRMLRTAARHADIVAFTGAEPDPRRQDGMLRLLDAGTLDERVALYRGLAADRAPAPELNILVQQVHITEDREAAAHARYEKHTPHLTPEQLLELPTLLIGTVTEIAGQLRAHRDRFGFSYITVLEPAMEAMAPVLAQLRGSDGEDEEGDE